MSVSVMASTTGLSGQPEMSPRTTRTVAVTCDRKCVYLQLFNQFTQFTSVKIIIVSVKIHGFLIN